MGRNVGGGTLGMYKCHNDGGNQEFVLTKGEKEFRHNDLCISADRKDPVGRAVTFRNCNSEAYQQWAYVASNIRPAGNPNLCLDSKNHASIGLTVEVCNHSKTQNFHFEMKNIGK